LYGDLTFLNLDGLSYSKEFEDIVLALSAFSNVKVTLTASQQNTLNTSLRKLTTVLLRFKKIKTQLEYTVFQKNLLILTSVFDLTVKAKSLLSVFQSSVNTDTAEASSNGLKIFQLLVKISQTLIIVGKYSFSFIRTRSYFDEPLLVYSILFFF
jgi:hypothetical protein